MDKGSSLYYLCKFSVNLKLFQNKNGFLFVFWKGGWDFPGSPEVKTPCPHCRGHTFDPWSGNWSLTCLCSAGKKELKWGQPVYRWLSGKESVCQWRRQRRHRFNSWVRKIPWRRKWQPTPVFLLGKSHGQRSLAGYTRLQSQTGLSTHTHIHTLHLTRVLDSHPPLQDRSD